MTSGEYNVQELEELAELIGEETLADTLDSYSCPLNPEVEDFLKHKARHSSKIGASVTYLVSGEDGALLGYFTLLLNALYPVFETRYNATNKVFFCQEKETNDETDQQKVECQGDEVCSGRDGFNRPKEGIPRIIQTRLWFLQSSQGSRS